ncbi:MAG: site-specific integrase [Lachnospiraceae bacterium]|nr:site-specific integrase [Lachnospiraceae bacterium]
MGRRGENIRKRKDGRWEARVICGRPVNGRTNYKYLYSRTYQGARNLKKGFLADLDTKPGTDQEAASASLITSLAGMSDTSVSAAVRPSAKPEKSPVLFRTVAEEWLESKKLSVKESSYAVYSLMVKKHILPEFGDLPINEVDSARIGKLLLYKKEHGRISNGSCLSDKTVSEIKGTLNRILRFAKSRKIIDAVPESIPVSVKQARIAVLTKQEQELMEAEALKEDTPFTLGILLCLNTGIREGELCGLRWTDFDWESGTLSISRTVSRISNAGTESGSRTRVIVGKPKTDCSIRTIPIPSDILPYLKERALTGDEYVVTGSEKFMEPRVCRDRFRRFERRARVKHHNFHVLRHTFSTTCVERGISIKILSEILGHSDIKITLQRYVHPSLESKKAEINKLPTFMSRRQE